MAQHPSTEHSEEGVAYCRGYTDARTGQDPVDWAFPFDPYGEEYGRGYGDGTDRNREEQYTARRSQENYGAAKYWHEMATAAEERAKSAERKVTELTEERDSWVQLAGDRADRIAELTDRIAETAAATDLTEERDYWKVRAADLTEERDSVQRIAAVWEERTRREERKVDALQHRVAVVGERLTAAVDTVCQHRETLRRIAELTGLSATILPTDVNHYTDGTPTGTDTDHEEQSR